MKLMMYFLVFATCYNANAQVLCPAKHGDKWGLINIKGSWIVKPKFDSIAYLYNGYATIYSKNVRKQGIINSKGDIIVKPTYDYIGLVENNMCLILKRKATDSTDYLTGYLNLANQKLIPAQFESGEDFSEGLAGVKDSNEKWGFINESGQLVIPFKFESIYSGFRGDTADVELEDENVYINKKGEVLSSVLSKPSVKTYNLIGVAGHLGRAKLNGDTIMRPIYDYFGYPQGNLLWYKLYDKFGLVNINGEFITEAKFDYLTYFSADLAPARIDNNWGFINLDGSTKIPFIYQQAKNFSHGLAAVKYKEKWGFINSKGKWKIKPKFENVADAFKDIKAKGESVVHFNYE